LFDTKGFRLPPALQLKKILVQIALAVLLPGYGLKTNWSSIGRTCAGVWYFDAFGIKKSKKGPENKENTRPRGPSVEKKALYLQ